MLSGPRAAIIKTNRSPFAELEEANEENEKKKRKEAKGVNRRNVLVKLTECQQSSVKTCHSWSLRSLLSHWRGMRWSFMAQNRQCSFAPSSQCTSIVSARTLFRRFLCPFRVLEVPFQDIHRDPLCSQAIAAPQTAVWDEAGVTLS